MAERIPDLWRAKESASRLYQQYLCRLLMNDLHERIVSACRQIRRYAASGPGRKEGLFTFGFEIDSLCELKDYKGAWRQLRLREVVSGQRFDLAHQQWSPADWWDLAFDYAPLQFFLGRYRQGCSLLETALALWFRRKKAQSYDVLFHVYNGTKEPRHRCGVTLAHFYARLGKGLRQWPHWEAFVNGFHPKLFRLAGVRRAELCADAGRLPVFFDNLRAIQAERTTSGVTWGLADLIEGPPKVRKRQETTQAQLDEFEERIRPKRARTATKLLELFPELHGLPR